MESARTARTSKAKISTGHMAAPVSRVSAVAEAVANAAHGIKPIRLRPELLAKPPDMRIHGARVNDAIIPPNVSKQLLPRLNSAPPLGQERHEPKFRGGQINRFAA